MRDIRRRVNHFARLHNFRSDALDLKRLFAFQDVDELVTLRMNMPRKPEAGRPIRGVEDCLLARKVCQIGSVDDLGGGPGWLATNEPRRCQAYKNARRKQNANYKCSPHRRRLPLGPAADYQ